MNFESLSVQFNNDDVDELSLAKGPGIVNTAKLRMETGWKTQYDLLHDC